MLCNSFNYYFAVENLFYCIITSTSLDMILAVGVSHTSERAIKSPNDDILSAPGEISPKWRPIISGPTMRM